MSGFITNTEISTGKSQGFHRDGGAVNGDAARREFWARAVMTAGLVLALLVLCLAGCDGPGSCARACRPRLMVSWSEPGLFSEGVCVCERGTAADAGAQAGGSQQREGRASR